MNAYLHPDTARELLAKSRAYTDAKRQFKREQQQIAAAFDQFRLMGFNAEQSAELALIQVRMVQQ
jgi:hypothetical protein